MRSFSDTRRSFSSFAKIFERSSTFRVAARRVRWRYFSYTKRKKSIDLQLFAPYNIRMTNYEKTQVRDHLKKWNFLYSMLAFLTLCILAIGWEARQEQKIKELEQYHEPTQNFEDIA